MTQDALPDDSSFFLELTDSQSDFPEALPKMSRTETVRSLEELGVSSEAPIPSFNSPLIPNPVFPEQYTLETPSGVVRLETLKSLGRKGAGFSPETEFPTFTLDDPENPRNWSLRLKWTYTFILSCAVVSAAYGSSSLAGGLFTISDKFGVSTEVSTLLVSLMVVGFSFGPLVWAPISETVGRRPVYFVSFFLYTLFHVPVALSPTIGGLLVCRFLLGVFLSASLTIVGASLADMHAETRGLAIALFAFCPYSGPVLGGVVNGFISVNTRCLDLMVWVSMAFAGVTWLAMALIPETYAPVILRRRAKALRKIHPHVHTEDENLSFSELLNAVLLRPLEFVVQEPVLVLVCGYVALIYALLYGFFFAYPVIFGTLYGYKDDKVGLMYIPILIGASFGLATTPFLERLYTQKSRLRPMTPEDRLIGAMVGAPFPCIALFILGATSYPHIFWVGPASSGIAFGYGMVLLYYALNNYILDTYARYAASAMATKVFLRSAGGAAFPLFTTQMYHKLGLQWASWLLAFIALGMAAVPFLFFWLGESLREKWCREDYTHNATTSDKEDRERWVLIER